MAESRPWLPDLCTLPRIAAVLGIAEMVVLVIALTPARESRWGLGECFAASAFALWIALLVTVVLCKARAFIGRLPTGLGIGLALALPMLAGGLGAWSLQRIDLGLGYHLTLPASETLRFVSSIALLSSLITAVALRYFYVREQWQTQVQAHAKAAVDALQARIRPHFLFNSMNTIASLIRHDPVTAERAVEDLADLFRAALGAGEGEATLAEEIVLARRYLAIESLRLGERLQVAWEIPVDLPQTLRLPRLTLQPLLENAVLHGISRLPEGGEIRISAESQGGRLHLRVRNPSLPPRERDSSNRHAQESIAQRLAFRFGTTATMTAGFADGYYSCELVLPLP